MAILVSHTAIATFLWAKCEWEAAGGSHYYTHHWWFNGNTESSHQEDNLSRSDQFLTVCIVYIALYTNIFREKKESFKVRVPLFAWGCIWCIDTVTLSQDALYIAQSAAVTLHPQILSPASSIMVTSQGNAGSIDTQGVSDLDLAHTLSILVLKWWDFSLSLTINKTKLWSIDAIVKSCLPSLLRTLDLTLI